MAGDGSGSDATTSRPLTGDQLVPPPHVPADRPPPTADVWDSARYRAASIVMACVFAFFAPSVVDDPDHRVERWCIMILVTLTASGLLRVAARRGVFGGPVRRRKMP